jgi:DNA-binding beta-propeller fold protein YncE
MRHPSKAARYQLLAIACCIALLLCLPGGSAKRLRAANLDTIADRVLGQPNFISNAVGSGATGLNLPWGIAIDRVSGRLYAADMQNHRVLSWPNAAMFTNGQAADIVIGQANFTGNQPNQGNATPSATSLNIPAGVTVDSQGSVFVSDSGNGRVLARCLKDDLPIPDGFLVPVALPRPLIRTFAKKAA